MPTIGSLNVAIKATTKKFQSGIKKARRALKKFKNAIPGANFLLSKFGAALTIGGFSYFIKSQMTAIDTMSKFADRIGMTTKALSELEYAAEATGVPIAGLRMGLQRMVRRVSTAAVKFDGTSKALRELGLRAKDLMRLAPEQQFRTIADAMQGVESRADQVRLAFALFDSEGVALVNTMTGGSAALDAMAERGRKLGYVVDDLSAHQLQNAQQSFKDIGTVITGVGRTITKELGPAIEIAGFELVEWAAGGEGAAGKLTDAIKDVVSQVGKLGDAWNAVRGIAEVSVGVLAWGLGEAMTKLGQFLTLAQSAYNFAAGVAGWDKAHFADALYNAGKSVSGWGDKTARGGESLFMKGVSGQTSSELNFATWNMQRKMREAAGLDSASQLSAMDTIRQGLSSARTARLRAGGWGVTEPGDPNSSRVLDVLESIERNTGAAASPSYGR